MEKQEGPCGFVAVTGRTNVGKSTLMNRILETKVSIVSDKPQTTRLRVRGVLTRKDGQLIFVDTPGVHKPHDRLGEILVQNAMDAWDEMDVILFMVEAQHEPGAGDRFIAERLENRETPVVLAPNKIDLLDRSSLEDRIHQYEQLGNWEATCPISARTGEGVASLIEELYDHVPTGPFLYPPEQVRDQRDEPFFAEVIREKVLECTREEVPHSVAVRVERTMPGEDQKTLVIEATIYVERESQKGIIIGKNGQMLQEIGSRARKELEEILDRKVYLDLWVKVQEKWRENEQLLQYWGFAT